MPRPPSISDDQVLAAMSEARAPLTAYDLIERLKTDSGAAPKPPVVYRALERLIASGRIHRLESRRAFVPCQSDGHKHETVLIVCSACGSVTEIEDHELCRSLARWSRETGYRFDQRVFEVNGLCPDCAPRTAAPRSA